MAHYVITWLRFIGIKSDKHVTNQLTITILTEKLRTSTLSCRFLQSSSKFSTLLGCYDNLFPNHPNPSESSTIALFWLFPPPTFLIPSPSRFTMPSLAFIAPSFPLCPHRPPSNLSPPRMSTATPDNASAAPQDHHLGLDWRAFRAHLVSTHRPHHHLDAMPPIHWAHFIPQVEVGCTLIANPSHAWPQSFSHLNRAVFLITDISSSGISGLLLNRPTRFKVAGHKSVLARVGHEFATNHVNLGGECSTGTLEVLHSFPPDVCPGATHIVSGLYCGGFNSARKLVQQNLASPDDFQFFVAYSRWTWEQFSAEMHRDAWILASCSPSLMLLGARSDIWHQVNSALESI